MRLERVIDAGIGKNIALIISASLYFESKFFIVGIGKEELLFILC